MAIDLANLPNKTALTLAGSDHIFMNSSGVASDVTVEALTDYVEARVQPVFMPAGTGAVATTVQSKLRESVSVKDFGAVGDGITDDTAAFNLAAQDGNLVKVPSGNWLISVSTLSAHWVLEKGAKIIGLPNVGNVGFPINDTSRLSGHIFAYDNGALIGVRVGSSSPWLEKNIRANSEGLAEFVSLSRNGGIGALFSSRSSDNPTPNMQTIGMSAFGVNDNIASPEPGWAAYLESVRYAGAGPSFGVEIDFVNLGNTYALDPYTPFGSYDATMAPTSSIWLSCGGGDSGLASASNPISAVITILPNSKKFNRGIIFRSDSITTNEAIVVPTGYQISWYRGANTVNSFIDQRQIVQTTSVTSNLGNSWNLKKDRDGNASIAIDTIARINYSGCSGGFVYSVGAFTQVIQRSNYSGGNARFSYDINVKNTDGTSSEVTLNGLSDKSFAPAPDNSISLGTGSFRWANIFAASGVVSTSDAREKTTILPPNQSEINAAISLSKEVGIYQFLDSVKIKGDAARKHIGMTVQRAIEIMELNGLDPFAYGFICFDQWDDKFTEHPEIEAVSAVESVLDEDGNVVTPEIKEVLGSPAWTEKILKAGDRFAFRYDQLNMFIALGLNHRLSALEL